MHARRQVVGVLLAGWVLSAALVGAAQAPRGLRGRGEADWHLEVAPPSESYLAASRSELSQILRQPAYTGGARPGPSLLERMVLLVARYVFTPLFGTRTGRTAKGVQIVSLVLLAVLLGHMGWELWHMFRRRRGAQAEEASLPEARVLRLMSSEELFQQGERLRAAGRLRRAMGCYYMALLSWLAAAGCTRLDRSLTNWEHYRRAADSGRLSPHALRRLADLNAAFDEHCYGGRAVSETALVDFRTRVVGLKEALHEASA